MATLKVVGSGSSGNSYIIETPNEILLLELGVSFKSTMKAFDYKMEKIVGCLVSHEHQDHAKSIPNALKYSIDVYSNPDVAYKYKGVRALEKNHKYKIGGFYVQPIEVPHNVLNYAYLIEHESFGRLLFATDLVRFPYRIKDLNYIVMECNYSEDLIIEKACEGNFSRSHSEYHHELNNCLESLKMLNNPKLIDVMLCHLSDFGSDKYMFIDRVSDEIYIEPLIAESGVSMELKKDDF